MLQNLMIVCVCEHVVGRDMDGCFMPMPTHPQRYCDLASLASLSLPRGPILLSCRAVGSKRLITLPLKPIGDVQLIVIIHHVCNPNHDIEIMGKR